MYQTNYKCRYFSYLWFKAFNFKALPLMAQKSNEVKEKFTSRTMLNYNAVK